MSFSGDFRHSMTPNGSASGPFQIAELESDEMGHISDHIPLYFPHAGDAPTPTLTSALDAQGQTATTSTYSSGIPTFQPPSSNPMQSQSSQSNTETHDLVRCAESRIQLDMFPSTNLRVLL